jgi:TetR/AcrR family transcriptional regulator, regulator of autoinduction and epiphytic fitness
MSSTEPELTTAGTVDGRRQRTQITRKNIIDAAIALQNEGNMRPSMQQISARAGVSLRTAFQHFPEKHQLTHAVLDELTRTFRVDPPSPELAKHSALEARIARFLDLRTRQLEGITPHRRASNAMIATSPLLQKHRLKVRKRFRALVETWFAAELDQLPPASRQKWLTAIATLVDWEMWQSLRTFPTRSIAESKAALALLLTAALNALDDAARQK